MFPLGVRVRRNGSPDLAPEISGIQRSASQTGWGGLGHTGDERAKEVRLEASDNVSDSAVPNPDDRQKSLQAPGSSSPEDQQGNGDGATDALPSKREEKAAKALKGPLDRSRKPTEKKTELQVQGQTKASQGQSHPGPGPGPGAGPGPGHPPKESKPKAQPKARTSPSNRDRPVVAGRQGAARSARPSSVPPAPENGWRAAVVGCAFCADSLCSQVRSCRVKAEAGRSLRGGSGPGQVGSGFGCMRHHDTKPSLCRCLKGQPRPGSEIEEDPASSRGAGMKAIQENSSALGPKWRSSRKRFLG